MQPLAPSSYGYAPPASPVEPPPGPLDGLAKVVGGLLALVAAAALFGGYAFLHRSAAIDDFLAIAKPKAADISPLDDADNLVKIAEIAFAATVAAAGIAWMVWQYRLGRNAERLAGPGRLSPWFGAFGWVIPIAWFVLPPFQLADAAKASDRSLPPGSPRTAGKAPPLIWIWWLVLLVGLGVYNVGFLGLPRGDEIGKAQVSEATLSDFTDGDRLVGIGALLLAVAGGLAIVVVLKVTQAQTARIHALLTGAFATPGPELVGAGLGAAGAPGPGSMAGAGGGYSSAFGQPPLAEPAQPGAWGSPFPGSYQQPEAYSQPAPSQPQADFGLPAPAAQPPAWATAPGGEGAGPSPSGDTGGFTIPGGSPTVAGDDERDGGVGATVDAGDAGDAGDQAGGGEPITTVISEPGSPPPSREPAWHPDPFGEAGLRWWDGKQWTNHISGQPSGS